MVPPVPEDRAALQGGSRAASGERGLFAESPLSCRSSALSFEGANTDGDLLLRRMRRMRRTRRTRITSTHGYGTHRLPVGFFLGRHSSANLEQASSCAVMQPDTV